MVIDFIQRKGASVGPIKSYTDAFSDGLQVAHIASTTSGNQIVHFTATKAESVCQTYERAKRLILETLDAAEGEDD